MKIFTNKSDDEIYDIMHGEGASEKQKEALKKYNEEVKRRNAKIEQGSNELEAKEKAIGPEHPDLVPMLKNLAALHKQEHNNHRAKSFLRRALDIQKKADPDHLDVARTLRELALIYEQQEYCSIDEQNEYESCYQDALAVYEKNHVSDDHPDVADTLNKLEKLYLNRAVDYTQVELVYERVLARLKKNHGQDSICVAEKLILIAEKYFFPANYAHVEPRPRLTRANYAQIEPLFQRALAILEKATNTDHSKILRVLDNLAQIYCNQANYTKAEQFYQRALAIQKKEFGPRHPKVATTLQDLAWIYTQQANYNQAESLVLQALDIWKQATVEEVLKMPDDRSKPSAPYFSLLRYTNPLTSCYSCSQEELAQSKLNHKLIIIWDYLATIYLVQKKYTEAKQAKKEVLDIQENYNGTKLPRFASGNNVLTGLLSYSKGDMAITITSMLT